MPPAPTSAGGDDDSGNGDNGKVGEFTTSEISFTPPLPRTEVAITLKFRVTVSLMEGDVVYVHLPKFNGPPAQQFGLQSVSSTVDVRNGGEGINTATYFRGFWSGTTAKVTSAVHQVLFKRGKKGGAPPKQVLLLQCLRDVPANALLIFNVPRALGIVSPDKLPANSSRLKIEGPHIYLADNHRILKQIILASSEIRKQTVVEELAVYEHCIAQVIRDGGLQIDDRQLSEQLSVEETDQLWQAAQYRRRYPVPMAWTVVQEISMAYEAAGGFVKRIVQNAINCIKNFDPLAVHREVARNWGVKPAAVVMLDDFLSVQWVGLYPGLPRASLFAACLLTMEPEDVGRAFLGVAPLPSRSIAEDLMSAFRMRASLDAAGGADDASRPLTSTNTNDGSGEGDDPAETAAFLDEILQKDGSGDRCGATLDKWAALITALLPASFIVDSAFATAENGHGGYENHNGNAVEGEGHGSSKGGGPRVDSARTGDQDGSTFSSNDARAGHRHSSGAAMARGGGGGAVATLRPPPTLYLGYRDVPMEAQRSLRELKRGDWFVLPFLALARQSLPYAAVTPSSLAAASPQGRREEAVLRAGQVEADDNADDDDGAAVAVIPDNAVVVELHHVVEALELADVSFSPYNRAWLLPLATSCRVVTVEEDQHEVLHIVVDMEGSLVGQLNDSDLPQSDRSVATVILSKYLAKAEQTDFYVSSCSLLTALCARHSERRRLHPPTLIRAQYLSHYNAAMRASMAKYNVEATERVEWQVRTHDAQLLDEGVVKPAVWEPIQRKYMVTVEQFFLGYSRTVQKLEEGTLSVDLETYTIDYGGKGPRSLRRVVEKVYVTHEAVPAETSAILETREEQYTKQLLTLDNKLGISPNPATTNTGKSESAKRGGTVAGTKRKKS
ncbi:hypothetical protein ABB37_05444 [Leptomonas pyrrhocoris]|uniref:Uncharacterized protein n=1 Tax=Leptomonas pyrrhocoris TaxID=157538 RepID=A0A0N0DUZ5_LEPPY|nr:hypothetical protein ABB37_05444 [Leptomonas pyrrhocoris]XP_015658100.1 hypothetical protein ABB37_05444 [Leptomonas pyrrhocoris]KPA79660.1 hypothetical protein ABB37_05444 [Leptomonas pyrrhocoris]KPA79661.1 hypothetical protein ABB37_05444 [Leptomonas pyrrhocoris]|eukprot:XP_015658099.1 hypothetical protein ABB37_05444 [Leptomonas pyrrhocoris]